MKFISFSALICTKNLQNRHKTDIPHNLFIANRQYVDRYKSLLKVELGRNGGSIVATRITRENTV